MNDTKLFYVGNGSSLPGVPTRDLTSDMIEESGWSVADLVQSGLYKQSVSKAGKPQPSQTQAALGGSEDK